MPLLSQVPGAWLLGNGNSMGQKIDRQSRPPLCPCPNTCTPVYNGLADVGYSGPVDQQADGHSGDCIGKGDNQEFMVGGVLHRNDMNQCIFTPLKGVTRYQINEGDVDAMAIMCKSVLYQLRPFKKCDECRVEGIHVHWVVTADGTFCCQCHAKRS